MTPDFKDYLNLEIYKLLVQNNNDKKSEKSNDEYHKTLKTLFYPSVIKFLEKKRELGQLSLIQGGEGHKIRFLDAWNGMVANTQEFQENQGWNLITKDLTHSFIFHNTYKVARKDTITETDYQNGYQDLIEKVNKGDMPSYLLGSDAYCKVDDIRYNINIENWQINLVYWSEEHNKTLQIQPIKPLDIQEIPVEFKTGNLFIADWFRIEEFTNYIRKRDNDAENNEASINSYLGKQLQTKRHLEDFNMISVYCGNSVPALFVKDGVLVVGSHDEEYGFGEDATEPMELPEDMTEVGRVCCDLWWTTIIEKEQLVKILAEALLEKGEENPEGRAKVLLEDYIKQETNSYLNEIKVEPGQYWLYHYEGDDEFHNKFASPDLPLHPSIEAKFVLSPRRLELVEKLDVEKTQAPKI